MKRIADLGLRIAGRAAPLVFLGVLASWRVVPVLQAQDSIPRPEGVRVGITYAPGDRPGVTVIALTAALAAESVKAIITRDIEHSDRFEIVAAPDTVAASGTPDLRLLAALGSEWAVSVAAEGGGARVSVQLFEVASGAVRHRGSVAVGQGAIPDRWQAHRAADDIVRAASGVPGIAATQLLFVRGGRVWRVDTDGHAPAQLRTAGSPALSPTWSPDGRRIAYTAYVPAGQPLVIQEIATGAREVVPGTEFALNITPEFSPDGRRLAFARGTEQGTDIYVYELGGRVQRLTASRFADNLSPTWSPDGARIAFISTRARTPQLYVMSADGTDQEVLGRFDFGATGATLAPQWSPGGQFVAFHREVNGTPQIFVIDLASRVVRQLTGAGRNEDPTWAPDGRHLAYVSSRSGTRELWVVDIETGRVRQVTRLGGVRLPAWSPRLGGAR
jgi:TolB protein